MSINLKILKRLSKLEKKLDELYYRSAHGWLTDEEKHRDYSWAHEDYMDDYYEAVDNLNKMTFDFFKEEKYVDFLKYEVINAKEAEYLSKIASKEAKRAKKLGNRIEVQKGPTLGKKTLSAIIKIIDKSEKEIKHLDKLKKNSKVSDDKLNQIKSGYKQVVSSLRRAYRSLFLSEAYLKKSQLIEKLRDTSLTGKIKLYIVTLFKIIKLSMFEIFYLPSFFSVLFSRTIGALNSKKYSNQKRTIIIKRMLNKILPSEVSKTLAKIIKSIVDIVDFIVIILAGPFKLLFGYILYFAGMVGLALKYLYFIFFNEDFHNEIEEKFERMFRKDMFALMSMAKNFGFDPSARNLRKVFRDIISEKYDTI